MRSGTAFAIAASLAGLMLAGCATTATPGTPSSSQIFLDGQTVVIAPLTAGTWTARAPAPSKALPQTRASTAHLREAIEAASGCKVTDSDYSSDGRQFDAQLSCSGKDQ